MVMGKKAFKLWWSSERSMETCEFHDGIRITASLENWVSYVQQQYQLVLQKGSDNADGRKNSAIVESLGFECEI